jgi:amidophosphoribosyltransferase
MCRLMGVILGEKSRRRAELDRLAEIFTYLLVSGESGGPHATGAMWMNGDGEYELSKRPTPASEFIDTPDYARLIAGITSRTTVIMGHTRWRTRGSEQNNANNQPVSTPDGACFLTHNGTLLNADELFRRFRYQRTAEVDSELLCRIVHGATRTGSLDVRYLQQRLALCRGEMSAVAVSRRMPGQVIILKGNKPLAFRYHARRQVVLYATDASHLDEALTGERGWTQMIVPPMTLLVFDRTHVTTPIVRPFSFVPVGWRQEIVL